MTPMSPLNWLGRNAAKIGLVALLAVPAAVAVLDSVDLTMENRNLAKLPALPASWPALLALPAGLDAWINDHFGYRAELVQWNNELRFAVFHEFPSIRMSVGRHGRKFLSSHGTNIAAYSALTSACKGTWVASEGTAAYFNQMFGDFAAMGLHPRLLIIPTAAVVYNEDVPSWLADRCASTDTPVARLLASPELDARARANITYPLPQMRDIKQHAVIYPKTWFHWSGPGVGALAQWSLITLWGIEVAPNTPELVLRTAVEQSDVGFLVPGIDLPAEVTRVDLAASGVDACTGKHKCFGDEQAYLDKLDDVTRIVNPRAPKRRLLILSDSFGHFIAPWYARYYGTVEQISTNAMGQLTPAEVAKARAYLFRDPENTDFLMLYNDGGAIYNTLRSGMTPLHTP